MNELLVQTRKMLSNVPVTWAVCGGFALDLFIWKNIRKHGDIDICAFERDRDVLCRHMLSRDGWNVYEFRGGGKVRPLGKGSRSEAGRNLMCVRDGCDLVKFHPSDEDGLLWYEFFHTGITELNYLEFLFNTIEGNYFVFSGQTGIKRDLSQAILFRDGIPYLAPEMALLFKASNPENPDYRLDFDEAFPRMSAKQRQWFLESLNTLYPGGHRWNTITNTGR